MKKLLASALLGLALPLSAQPIKLAWDEYDEVAEMTAGFRLHLGPATGQYTQTLDIPDPAAQEYLLLGVDAGTYFVALTAYNTLGLESDYSNEITITVNERTDPGPPKPPGNLRSSVPESVDLRFWEKLLEWTQPSGNKGSLWKQKAN